MSDLQSKALFLYDGQCSFCIRWMQYLRKLTGDFVLYKPYQEEVEVLDFLPYTQLQASILFIEERRDVFMGAEAAFRALWYANRFRFLSRLYDRFLLVRFVSEKIYQWVSHRRYVLH